MQPEVGAVQSPQSKALALDIALALVIATQSSQSDAIAKPIAEA